MTFTTTTIAAPTIDAVSDHHPERDLVAVHLDHPGGTSLHGTLDELFGFVDDLTDRLIAIRRERVRAQHPSMFPAQRTRTYDGVVPFPGGAA